MVDLITSSSSSLFVYHDLNKLQFKKHKRQIAKIKLIYNLFIYLQDCSHKSMSFTRVLYIRGGETNLFQCSMISSNAGQTYHSGFVLKSLRDWVTWHQQKFSDQSTTMKTLFEIATWTYWQKYQLSQFRYLIYDITINFA